MHTRNTRNFQKFVRLIKSIRFNYFFQTTHRRHCPGMRSGNIYKKNRIYEPDSHQFQRLERPDPMCLNLPLIV